MGDVCHCSPLMWQSNIILAAYVFALQMPVFTTSELQIRKNGIILLDTKITFFLNFHLRRFVIGVFYSLAHGLQNRASGLFNFQ
jgi:hypothetical protein